MHAELRILHLLLVLAFALGPLLSRHFFITQSRAYRSLHAAAFALTTGALFFDLPWLTFGWVLFCVYGLFLFLKQHFLDDRKSITSPFELAQAVPFLFSIIAAIWLFCGANDLRLLGYGKHFSYYAALHGNFLGWLFVGCFAALVRHEGRFRLGYLASLGISFVSFLLIAYGIDGVPFIKAIGVAGLTIAVPLAQGLFLVSARRVSRLAFGLGVVSVLGLGVTMTLAWQNELGALDYPAFLGARPMASIHGLVNGVVVVPSFFAALAVYFRRA